MTLIGLDFFEDCAEYFLVLSELSNVNWTLNSAATTSQLFGKGDGINVFAEEAFVAGLYFNILMTWMQASSARKNKRQPLFKFLNCPNILEKATQYSRTLLVAEKEESLAAQLFGPGIVSSPKGYTNTIKIYYLLKIIVSYPSLATEDLSSDDCQKLNDICDSLKEAIKI